MSKLNALDITIILDTLRSSLRVTDNGMLFSYTNEARKETMLKVIKAAQNAEVDIKL